MEQNNWEISQYIDVPAREAESVALGLPTWMVPLWDGIHAWAANLGTKAMKKHVESTAKRGRIPSMCAAVGLVNLVVDRAVAAERARIRRELEAWYADDTGEESFPQAFARICPE